MVQQSSSPLHSFMSELLANRPRIPTLEFVIIDDNARIRKIRHDTLDSSPPLGQRRSNESRWGSASITLGESMTTTAAPMTRRTAVQSRRSTPRRKEGRTKASVDTYLPPLPKRQVSSDNICQMRKRETNTPSSSASSPLNASFFDETSQLKLLRTNSATAKYSKKNHELLRKWIKSITCPIIADSEEEMTAFGAAKTESLCKLMKEVVVLEDNSRLADSPCRLVTGLAESIMKTRALRDATQSAYMSSKKTMEINPTNSSVVALREKAEEADQSDNDTSFLLTSGFALEEEHATIDDDDDAGADDDMNDLPPLDSYDDNKESAVEQVGPSLALI
jgi:hypothetical protein